MIKNIVFLILLLITAISYSQEYKTDILGNGFEQKTIQLKDDYEGEVVATLIRKKCSSPSTKAVLYIHGFNDYFFQKEMAEKFNEHQINFYALDIRKYGRSYRMNQTFNNVRNIDEYDEEINKALDIIEKEGNNKVLLAGHSTGGLIQTLFASKTQNPIVKGLWVNSPFYEYNMSWFVRKVGIPIVSARGKRNPDKKIGGGFSPFYGRSLHKDFEGEWDYDLRFKPNTNWKVNYGFIRAIHLGHKKVQNGLKINMPVLVMHSDRSSNPKEWNDDVYQTDLILNVKHIRKYGEKIHDDVTLMEIPQGIHDLVLSQPKVRSEVYRLLFDWLEQKGF